MKKSTISYLPLCAAGILMLSFAANVNCAESRSADDFPQHVLDAMAAHKKRIKLNEEKFKNDLPRIIQTNQPFRTISLSFTIERSEDGGKSWTMRGRNRLDWDIVTNSGRFTSDRGGTSFRIGKDGARTLVKGSLEKSTIFLNNGIRTNINERASGGKSSAWAAAGIDNDPLPPGYCAWIDDETSLLMEYQFAAIGLRLVDENLTKRWDFLEVEHNGKAALKLSSPEIHIFEGLALQNVVFDRKTGTILAREDHITEKKNGKLEKILWQRITVSDYIEKDGYFFPAILTWENFNPHRSIRFTVDKKTIKFNEPIDKDLLVPRFPPGCRVNDSINRTSYVTPAIGDSGAEEVISKRLDELFQDANK